MIEEKERKKKTNNIKYKNKVLITFKVRSTNI